MTPLLLLEDEPRVASFLQRGLAAEGFAVTLSRTGDEALAIGLDGRHDLIVLDVGVPGIDGFEVCGRLRAGGIATPILMLTARDAPADVVEGLGRGADDYLTKPFPFDVLLARLNALHRRRHLPLGAAAVAVRTAGPLAVDMDAHEASLNGVPLDLTPRELDVLDLFAANPGRVLSRERILAAAWGATEDPLTNVVDVYVGRLRRKLGDDVTIVTVRGTGYKLVIP